MSSEELLVERRDGVATLTLNRPAKRNALTARLLGDLANTVIGLDADATVRVMILTGSDPAFCAGIDLRNLGTELANTRILATREGPTNRGLLPPHNKVIIGAINGPAVTGGLELALGCDFLVASEHASFADTHARVGVMPGGGMTVRLPELIGVDRARRMSFTGDFVDANTAMQWGLVTEVTSHEQLLPRVYALAASIAAIDPAPVLALRALYEEIGDMVGEPAWTREQQSYRAWMKQRFDAAVTAQRIDDVMERGSRQI